MVNQDGRTHRIGSVIYTGSSDASFAPRYGYTCDSGLLYKHRICAAHGGHVWRGTISRLAAGPALLADTT